MTVRISLSGGFDSSVSADLNELADSLAENRIDVAKDTVSVPGLKVELIVGLAIASLAVSSVSTLIAAITFWRTQKKAKYRLSVDSGSGPFLLDDASIAKLKDAAESGNHVSVLLEKL